MEQFEREPVDESIGLFLYERMANDIQDLGNHIYARDNAYVAVNYPPLSHDLAAQNLEELAVALHCLADLERRRAMQGGTGVSGT